MVDDVPAVGVVGLGNIGHEHAALLAEQPATLAGGVDVDAAARERFRERFDVPVFESVDPLLDAADCVLVTTPNRFHEEPATRALDADVSVLVEKPLAHDLASAERVAAAHDRSDGFCMVGFKNRFTAAVSELERLVRDGELGRVRHVDANYVRSRGVPEHGGWYVDAGVAGGGCLLDIGVHAIDLALYLCGFPAVTNVAGATRPGPAGDDESAAGLPVEAAASAFVECEDGTTISLETAWATNRPPCHEVHVRGSAAGACFDIGDHSLTLYRPDASAADGLAAVDRTPPANDSLAAEQRAFLDVVQEGSPPEMNTVDQALVVQRVVDEIYAD